MLFREGLGLRGEDKGGGIKDYFEHTGYLTRLSAFGLANYDGSVDFRVSDTQFGTFGVLKWSF